MDSSVLFIYYQFTEQEGVHELERQSLRSVRQAKTNIHIYTNYKLSNTQQHNTKIEKSDI